LNQNPRFYASSTSIVPAIIEGFSNTVSNIPEYKSELKAHKEETLDKTRNAMRAVITEWYKPKDKEVIFDKSRGWGHKSLILNDLFPDAKLIICVRDLRNVFSSIEKQHRKNPLLEPAADLASKTIYARADQMFSPQGMVGFPLDGLQDAMRRDGSKVIIVRYEQFVQDPSMIFYNIYSNIGEELFKHDFENIENVSEDLDELYLDKFPHNGDGKVKGTDENEWKEYVPEDIANLIMGKFQWFNQMFGYK
jgi:sulfotransferase